MRVFAVYNPLVRHRRPCAWLAYDSAGDSWTIELADDAASGEVPLLFESALARGEHEIGGELARRWAESRTISAERDDVEQVLEEAGLAEHYLPTLLAATRGRSSCDDFLLAEVPQDGYRDAEIDEPPGTPRELGVALGRARRAQGMTQAQLARRCGIQQAQISRIESGRGNPTLTTLEALARGVGRTLRWRLD